MVFIQPKAFRCASNSLADLVARVARRASVDRRAAAVGVLREMQAHVHEALFIDKYAGVIANAGAKCHTDRAAGVGLDHGERRGVFGLSNGGRKAVVDDEA